MVQSCSGSSERYQSALAMADQPDTFTTHLLLNRAHPVQRVLNVIVQRHSIGIHNRVAASEHSSFVYTYTGDSFPCQSFCQKLVWLCRHTKGVVPVAIGGP